MARTRLLTDSYTAPRIATMSVSQARPRAVEGHLNGKVLLLYLRNLGETVVSPVLPMGLGVPLYPHGEFYL